MCWPYICAQIKGFAMILELYQKRYQRREWKVDLDQVTT